MRKSRIRLIVAGLLVGLAFAGTPRASGEGIPGVVISRGSRPYTDTWKRIVQRDLQIQYEIRVGLRPPPPRIKVASPNPSRSPVQLRGGPGLQPTDPQTIGTNFIGINLQDQFNTFGGGAIPPDTMGAIGPNHFLQVINASVAVYNRSGTRLSHVSLNSFFTISGGYPRGGAFDPRVLYDRRSGRWFACALDTNSSANNHILLAVSRTDDPTGTWDKYVIPVGETSTFTDYDTLGTDDNGVYFGMSMFTQSSEAAKIAATPKASLLAGSPTLGPVSAWNTITDMWSSPQPAHNQDAASAIGGRAWFVSSSTTEWGNVNYRTLTWSGSVPSLNATQILTTPVYSGPIDAPASGSGTDLDVGDDRLEMAVIRNGQLWTCRSVGVNSSGADTGADRTGCEWLQLDVTGATSTLTQSGRVYDPAATGFRFYFYPSIMVSGQGHAAMGFSGSKSAEYAGAYTCGRLAADPLGTMQTILQVKAGAAAYQILDVARNRWGDYSFTSLDPNDDMTLWTIQEYATGSVNIWGTWIAKLLSVPPALNNPNGSGNTGQTGVILNLTGTGFYDPGAGYTNRLNVQLTGGATNGISNYAITYNSPTSVTVTFDIAANATAGTRNIVLTNPDSQSVTVVGGFTVQTGIPTTLTAADGSGSIGEAVTLQATLIRTSDSTPVSGMTIAFKVAGDDAGTAVTNLSGVASRSYLIAEGLGTGAKTISADYAGDSQYQAASGTGTLTVNKANVTLTVPAVSGVRGQPVSLKAGLTRATDSSALSDKTLTFQVDGTTVGTNVTAGAGTATVSYLIPLSLAAGVHRLTGVFDGDTLHNPGTGVGPFRVIGRTVITVASVSGDTGQIVTLRAALRDPDDGTTPAGRELRFAVDGVFAGAGITNSQGTTSINYRIPASLSPGLHTVTVTFAGNWRNTAGSGSGSLTVWTNTTLTAANVTGSLRQRVILTATLSRAPSGARMSGKEIVFTVNGVNVGSATTDSKGVASLRYGIPPSLGTGAKPITVLFVGEAGYRAGAGAATLTVNP